MKNILSYTMAGICLLYVFSGCNKQNNNTTQYVIDQHAKYIGTWKGPVNDTLKTTTDTLTLSIYRESAKDSLLGYATYRNVIYKIRENAFFGGISFNVINYDPQCQTSSLSLNTVLTDSTHVLIYLWGDLCNGLAIGTSGTIPRISRQPDLTHVMSFGRNGHSWTWKVTKLDNTTCSFTNTIVKDFGNGVFRYSQSNTCGWQNSSTFGYWYVSPMEWGNMTDSLPINRFTMLRTDAAIGTVYRKMIAQDSVVNTVESLNDNISVNGQQYYCARIRTKQWHSGTLIIHGLQWINYQYGFIKFANQITTGPLGNIQFEELQSKNF
jgi:hypothetical protein